MERIKEGILLQSLIFQGFSDLICKAGLDIYVKLGFTYMSNVALHKTHLVK